MTAARRFHPPLPAESLAALRVPRAIGLVPGGSRLYPLPLLEPPDAALDSVDDDATLDLLGYAGARYAEPSSAAARCGIRMFRAGRALGLAGPHKVVSFDWDHTLSNYQIFEDVPALLRVRRMRSEPLPPLGRAPMVAIEMARPFVTEFAFGAMAGFALRQGIERLAQWHRYRPQVCVATHTWPDRLALMASHFMPILPLMEGLLPGSPATYDRFMSPEVRSVIHLHHFLGYADGLMTRFERDGAAALTLREREELAGLFDDARAHHRKPVGAWAARGWDLTTLLHFDDSTGVVEEHQRQARVAGHAGARVVHLRHPHSRWFGNIQEWHKVSWPALWRDRRRAIEGVARHIARREAQWPCADALLASVPGGADTPGGVPRYRRGLPEGVVIPVHETPTTLGEFWRYYVDPVNRTRRRVRDVMRLHGGAAALRVAPGGPGSASC
jgi:hypothetical protein